MDDDLEVTVLVNHLVDKAQVAVVLDTLCLSLVDGLQLSICRIYLFDRAVLVAVAILDVSQQLAQLILPLSYSFN